MIEIGGRQRINPGDIKINSAIILNNQGQGINISLMLTQINLYESLNHSFVTGDITISDSLGLIESMPLIGEEQLYLDVETPGFPDMPNFRRHGLFLLYKLSGLENLSIKNRLFTMHFVSIEMLTDLNCKISKTFRGTPSSIVTQLLAPASGSKSFLSTNKRLDIDTTVNEHNFTANFWTPVYCVNYLTSRAVDINNDPSFVFFENNVGFNFKTLSSLYRQPEYTTFVRSQRMRPPSGEGQTLGEEYAKVLDMSTKTHHDYLQRLQNAFYTSSAITYDTLTKTVQTTERLARRDWIDNLPAVNRVSMNKSPAITRNLQALPESVYKTQCIARMLHSSDSVLSNRSVLSTEHHLKRLHKISLLSASSTNIQVFGRFDYTVGQKINLVIYRDRQNVSGDSQEFIIDDILSGFYLITALNHNITQKAHFTNIELSKESYQRENL